MKKWVSTVGILLVTAGILAGVRTVLWETAKENAERERQEIFQTILPGSTSFAEKNYTGEDQNIRTVYEGETGYIVETKTDGYVHEIALYVGVDKTGTVTGLTVKEEFETRGLGAEIVKDRGFLEQYLGTKGTAEVGADIDGITGATVTSKAVTKAVNSASAYVTGADITSSATEWGN